MVDVPADWRHDSGYRLNAAQKSITYKQEGSALKACIEACLNESREATCMEYAARVFDPTGGHVAGPEFYESKTAATARLEVMMQNN